MEKDRLHDIEFLTSLDGVEEMQKKLSRIQLLIEEVQKELNSISEIQIKLKIKD